MPETIADELLVNIRLKTEALEEGLAQMRSLLAKSSAQVERLSSAQAKAAEAAAQAQAKAAAEAASAAQKEAERLKAAYDAAYKALEKDATEAALNQAEALETAASKAQEAATRAAREQVVAEQDAQTARITAIRAAEAESKRASEEAARAAEEAAERTKQAQAQVAAAATAAFAGIVLAIRGAIEAANEYNNAMVGLNSLAEGTGQDFGDLQAAAEDLASDGLMTVADAAASLKNLLARGFSADEAVDMLERLKDAAAFGRQSSLSLGEAVRSASEGIKNENSVLVDNAGVTKNVAVMWEEYAATIGKSAANLTQAEKRQAEYNGIMAETAYQVGDAARYAEAFAGKQAALEAATLRVNQALGASVQGALTPLLEAVTPLVDALAGWIERNPELTAGIVAATAAGVALTAVVTGAIPMVKSLAAAFATLHASMGVVGAISLAVGALAGIAAACANARSPLQELNEELEGLQDELEQLSTSAGNAEQALAVLESGAATTDELAAAKQRLAEIFPTLVVGYDSEGNVILANNDLIREQIELTKELRRLKQQEAQEVSAQAVEEAKKRRDELEGVLRQLEAEKAQLEQERAAYIAQYGQDAPNVQWYDEELAARGETLINRNLEYRQSLIDLNAQLQAQYALVNESLGEADAATQLAMASAMEYAAQLEMTGAEYQSYLQTVLADEQQMAAYREEAAAAAREEAAAVEELASAQEAVDTAGSAAEQQRAAKQMRAYVEEVKNGTKGTATYQKAVEELTDAYGMYFPNVEQSIDSISDLVGYEEDLARTAVESARTAIDNLIAEQNAIIQLETASAEAKAEAVSLISVLSQLRNAMTGLLIDSSLPEIPVPSVSSGGGGGGGGGSEKSRWEMELDELEHYAALGQDVTEQQIAAIRRILEEEKLSTEERWRLEEELYDKESALIEDKISLYKDLTNLTTEEAAQQAAALQYMLQTYALSTEERAALTEQLNETKKALDGDYLRDYIAHLEQILAAEQLNAAQRKNVLNEIMQARIQLMQREQEAMQESISAQISAIEAERDAQIAAIDKEIEALDKLLEQRKRLQQEEEDEDALRRLQESLKYEKDDYNRQQLEKQIEQKQKEIADREFEQNIQDQKDALKAEQDAIRERAQAQIEGLQAMAEQKTLWLETQYLQQQEYNALELEQQNAQNALLLEGQVLYGEQSLEAQQALYGAQYGAGEEQNDAMVALTDEGQQRDVETLLSYEDDWSGAGHTLGGALESALQSHFDAIVAAAETMASTVVSIVANAMAQINSLRSAASSLQSMGGGTASSRSGGSARSTNVTINQTNNFSGSSPSPSAIRAATKGAAQTLLKY
mgnify:CR=1 FL=1